VEAAAVASDVYSVPEEEPLRTNDGDTLFDIDVEAAAEGPVTDPLPEEAPLGTND